MKMWKNGNQFSERFSQFSYFYNHSLYSSNFCVKVLSKSVSKSLISVVELIIDLFAKFDGFTASIFWSNSLSKSLLKPTLTEECCFKASNTYPKLIVDAFEIFRACVFKGLCWWKLFCWRWLTFWKFWVLFCWLFLFSNWTWVEHVEMVTFSGSVFEVSFLVLLTSSSLAYFITLSDCSGGDVTTS